MARRATFRQGKVFVSLLACNENQDPNIDHLLEDISQRKEHTSVSYGEDITDIVIANAKFMRNEIRLLHLPAVAQ